MRLSARTLDQLPPDVARPSYDRSAMRQGVVHLGVGAFHRAHQAVVFDDALAGGDMRWGITGVSLRSAGVRDQLVPQDGLYTVVVRDGRAETARIIGAVRDALVAPENPQAVIAAIAAPETHIITLTITEKGYKLDRATGGLLRDDPDVAHDLSSLEAPRTAAGFIVAGLAKRRAEGLSPITVISCDNLPDNGHLLREAVLAMAHAHDADLASWIDQTIAFPATMIDRIVPATTREDIDALADRLGLEDQAMVKAEPFLQWVIEDRFSGERPDFEALGVQLASRIAPWEMAKLRLLNGAHSAIAYLGGLAGDQFVHEFVARDTGKRFVEALWDEAEKTLVPPAGLDVAAYRLELMARFSNPALQHRTKQIAMDGSQKLPQRLLATVRDRRAKGEEVDALALGVAAWMRWQAGETDAGEAFLVDDPIADSLAEASKGGPAALLSALSVELDENAQAKIAGYLEILEQEGAKAAILRVGTSA